jgi:hypothetical protein
MGQPARRCRGMIRPARTGGGSRNDNALDGGRIASAGRVAEWVLEKTNPTVVMGLVHQAGEVPAFCRCVAWRYGARQRYL